MMRGVAMMWGWAGRGWTLLTLLTLLAAPSRRSVDPGGATPLRGRGVAGVPGLDSAL